MLLWPFLLLLFSFSSASCTPSQPFGPWRHPLPDISQDPRASQSHGLIVLALPYESDTGVDIQKAGIYAVRLFLTSQSASELQIHRQEILGLSAEKNFSPRAPAETVAKIKESPALTEAAKALALRELVEQVTRSLSFPSVGAAGSPTQGGSVSRTAQEAGPTPRSQEYYETSLEKAITAEFTNRTIEEVLKIAPGENLSRLLFFTDRVTEVRIPLRDARSGRGFEIRVQVASQEKRD